MTYDNCVYYSIPGFVFNFMSFLIVTIIILCIITLLYVLNWLLNQSNHYTEKISVYECGFEPFLDANMKFDILHWILALLYLIFDLELIFLFPFGSIITKINSFYILMILWIFLMILTLGFIYEWLNNALRLTH